ncbi:LacI family DNA-binding transcriptional regulator [Brevibacterium spongiae]|uniref:LacI family transcriptional regulator n=1 Tax=Brevibacterium spongiae TaxID=2909672 RepID=A0ABY5SM07_9MICO|nr:LacI family DNA-binding transcriptional regulator [Brevibacterium spongiae]UVI35189.1 LacI family transcriptional regulator [Brevibacterium spongiae]
MAKQNDRPTLATVAARAGVSIKTASRVLNGEKHVAASTAEKVEDAAAELGFRLNPTARRLRAGGRSPYIGVVLSSADDPYQVRVLSALEAELSTVDLRPVVTVTADDPDREEAFLDECLANDLSGIIVVRSQPDTAHIYTRAASTSGVRVVSFDPAVSGDGISIVTGDDVDAGYRAARQLLDHGHIALGVVGDHSTSIITTRRLEGIQSAFAGRHDVGWRAYMREDAHDEASAKNVVAAWLGSRSAPSALITLSATLTQGAIDACRRLDDWPALVGIDDFPTAELLDVTVVDRDVETMAAEAVRRLQDDARERPGRLGGGADQGQDVFPVRVIPRGSGEESPELRRRNLPRNS